MGRAIAIAWILGSAALAHAQPSPDDLPEDATRVDESTATPEDATADRIDRLVLDETPLFREEGLRSERDGAVTAYHVGGADLRFAGDWWSNVDDQHLPPIDLPTRGWKAQLELSKDLGWFTLMVGGGITQVDVGGLGGDRTRGRGRSVDLGIWLVHKKKLSRWVTWWLALGAGYTTWLPGSDADLGRAGYHVGLSIGTTFK